MEYYNRRHNRENNYNGNYNVDNGSSLMSNAGKLVFDKPTVEHTPLNYERNPIYNGDVNIADCLKKKQYNGTAKYFIKQNGNKFIPWDKKYEYSQFNINTNPKNYDNVGGAVFRSQPTSIGRDNLANDIKQVNSYAESQNQLNIKGFSNGSHYKENYSPIEGKMIQRSLAGTKGSAYIGIADDIKKYYKPNEIADKADLTTGYYDVNEAGRPYRDKYVNNFNNKRDNAIKSDLKMFKLQDQDRINEYNRERNRQFKSYVIDSIDKRMLESSCEEVRKIKNQKNLEQERVNEAKRNLNWLEGRLSALNNANNDNYYFNRLSLNGAKDDINTKIIETDKYTNKKVGYSQKFGYGNWF